MTRRGSAGRRRRKDGMALDERRGGRTTPSVAEVRRVCQPTAVTTRDAEHWTAGLYLRRVSPHLTRRLIPLGVQANTVTALMIAAGVLAGPALLLGGVPGAVLAVLLGQLQMLLDCCDGEVARWHDRRSAVGVFLDKVGHHGAELSIAVCLGLAVALDDPSRAWAPGAGALLAALVGLNRALNDMVHASRAAAGLAPLGSTARAESRPVPTMLARLRAAARFLPVHRAFHSVELTLLVLLAAVAGALTGLPVTAWLLAALVPAAALTVVGHTAAILGSRRLR